MYHTIFTALSLSNPKDTTANNGDDPSNNSTTAVHPSASSSELIVCQLEAKVSAYTLRSSLHVLLLEMSNNGIDPNNERVLKDMEDVVLGGNEEGGW